MEEITLALSIFGWAIIFIVALGSFIVGVSMFVYVINEAKEHNRHLTLWEVIDLFLSEWFFCMPLILFIILVWKVVVI